MRRIKIRRIEEREEAAVRAALNGAPSLLNLLPFKSIGITDEAHRKNANIGRILDAMSGMHFEWYGYSLAEKGDLSLIVDTLIQPNQNVTGADVDFAPIEAKKAFDELQCRNAAEGRLGSASELAPVGIVHRHGFSASKPIKSPRDVRNLSNYVRWQAAQTEFLSTQTDHFEQVGPFTVQVNGSTIRLVPKAGEHLILSYHISEPDDDAFARSVGLDPAFVRANGGLAQLIGRMFGRVAQVSAEQNRFVSHATSLIYNQDGKQPFGEIIVLASGTVEGKYEHAYEVPIKVVAGKRPYRQQGSDLEKEVDAKISWARKKVIIYLPESAQPTTASQIEASGLIGPEGVKMWERFWPAEAAIEPVRKSNRPEYEESAIDFFLAAATYVNECRRPWVKYSCFLFAVLSRMDESSLPISEAVKSVGELFKDPVNRQGYLKGYFPRPPVECLSAAAVVAKMYSPDAERRRLEASFAKEIARQSTFGINKLLERYVPEFLAQGREK